MTSMKRSSMALALVMGILGIGAAVGPPAEAPPPPPRNPKKGKSDPPTVIRRPMPRTGPRLVRYRAIDRVERTKQHDQQEKLARRAERSRFDDQLHARQKAKWG